MNSNDELKALLGEFESVVLSLNDATTLNKLVETNEKLQEISQEEQAYLQSKKENNDKLQKELDDLIKQSEELENKLEEKDRRMSKLRQENELVRREVQELETEHKTLMEKLSSLEDSIENDNKRGMKKVADNGAVPEKNPIHLQLAIYQGLGITLRMDDNERITEASLTSSNGQDIRIIQLHDDPVMTTANRIWDFIS